MDKFTKKVIKHYNAVKEEERFADRRKYLEYDIVCHILSRYIKKKHIVLDCAAGTGAYISFLLDKECNYVVASDISERNVSVMNSAYKDFSQVHICCQNAMNLQHCRANQFDIVLCMGPLYHQKPERWDCIISECLRVVKPKGNVVFSYMNRHFFLWNLINNPIYKLSVDDVFYLLKNGVTKPNSCAGFLGCCYFTSPEEIESIINRHQCEIVEHLSVDMELGNFYDKLDQLSNKDLNRISEYIKKNNYRRTLLGASKNNIIIVKKI